MSFFITNSFQIKKEILPIPGEAIYIGTEAESKHPFYNAHFRVDSQHTRGDKLNKFIDEGNDHYWGNYLFVQKRREGD